MKYLPFFFIITVLSITSSCVENNQRTTDIRDEVYNNENVDASTTTTTVVDDENEKLDKSVEGFGADYENQNRVIWQKPEMVLDMMGDLSNKNVADIGAGTGHFALRLAKKAKSVIAIDIDKKFTNYIDSVKVLELPETYQGRLTTRLASEDNPNLNDNELDYAVVVNTYMYVGNRVNWLKQIVKGLKSNGKVMLIDFKKKKTPVGPPSEYRVPLYIAERELEQAGFINIQTNDTALDYQYIVVGEKR